MVVRLSTHPLEEPANSPEETGILPPWAGQHQLVQVVTRLVNYKLGRSSALYPKGIDHLMLLMSSRVRMHL